MNQATDQSAVGRQQVPWKQRGSCQTAGDCATASGFITTHGQFFLEQQTFDPDPSDLLRDAQADFSAGRQRFRLRNRSMLFIVASIGFNRLGS